MMRNSCGCREREREREREVYLLKENSISISNIEKINSIFKIGFINSK